MDNYTIYDRIKKTKEVSYYQAQIKISETKVTIHKLNVKCSWEELLAKKDIVLMKQEAFTFLPRIRQIIRDSNRFHIVTQQLIGNLDDMRRAPEFKQKPSHPSLYKLVEIATQMLEAVKAMQDHSIQMGNLRPQCFFFDGKTLKMAHFSSQNPDPSKSDFLEWQDLKYQAPENVLSSKPLDSKSNVFSIGCIIGEILLGETLVHSKSKMDYIYAITQLFPNKSITSNQSPSPQHTFEQKLRKRCSKQLAQLLVDMTRVSPAQRIGVVQALAKFQLIDRAKLLPEPEVKAAPPPPPPVLPEVKPTTKSKARKITLIKTSEIEERELDELESDHGQKFERIQQVEESPSPTTRLKIAEYAVQTDPTKLYETRQKTTSTVQPKQLKQTTQTLPIVQKKLNEQKQSISTEICFGFEQNQTETIDRMLQILKLTKPLRGERNIDDDVTQALIIKKSEAPELPQVRLANLKTRTNIKMNRPQLTNFALNEDTNLGVQVGNSFLSEGQPF